MPPPTPTPQQVDEIVKRTRATLFDRLKPYVNGDRTDFDVAAHSGRIEFTFPFKNTPSLMPLLRMVTDYAKEGANPQNEVCVNFLRGKFLVIRIKDTTSRFGPPYRLEVMVPLNAEGNGLVMINAQSVQTEDVTMLENLYKYASGKTDDKGKEVAKEEKVVEEDMDKIVEQLRALGVDVMIPNTTLDVDPNDPDKRKPCAEADKMWDGVAGYEAVKMAVKQCITLPLVRPDLFARMGQLTRGASGGKKTSGVLFTGPPGCGKTTMARVASHVAATPLVYVPVESVVSKWYGEAEQRLRSVFELTRKLGNAVLFLDELDAFAGNRDAQIHEVTRRILSVLLRQLDGLDAGDDEEKKEGEVVEGEAKETKKKQHKHVVLVGATNRVQDLDAALRSRFNKIVEFPLPDEPTRAAVFKTYATVLEVADCAQLAANSEGFSCRDIRECCDDAEHLWVAQLLEHDGFNMSYSALTAPPYTAYLEACLSRQASHSGIGVTNA
jgi:SpoVK/Ycf46/Vps4 family AAA+-type ATPase